MKEFELDPKKTCTIIDFVTLYVIFSFTCVTWNETDAQNKRYELLFTRM